MIALFVYGYGHSYEGLDEYMKRRLEIKLIQSIVTMN